MPVFIISCDCAALIQANEQPVGEVTPSGYVALPLSDTATYYLTAVPLANEPDTQLFPVTRKIETRDGKVSATRSPELEVCAWQNGVYEVALKVGRIRERRPQPEPHTVALLDWREDGRLIRLTLYYENGLKLFAEEGSRVLCSMALSAAAGEAVTAEISGEMRLLDVGSARLLAVKAGIGRRERLLLLDSDMLLKLDISGDGAGIDDGRPYRLTRLDSSLGHERRTRYEFIKDEFVELREETGFFSHIPDLPASDRQTAVAFLDAVRLGFREEALGYLSTELARSLDFQSLCEFFGSFTAIRSPRADDGGSLMGLLYPGRDGITEVKVFRFEFEGGRISNIGEE